MTEELRHRLLRDLYDSLEDIRKLQRGYRNKIEELEKEEDMTLLAIRDLEKMEVHD